MCSGFTDKESIVRILLYIICSLLPPSPPPRNVDPENQTQHFVLIKAGGKLFSHNQSYNWLFSSSPKCQWKAFPFSIPCYYLPAFVGYISATVPGLREVRHVPVFRELSLQQNVSKCIAQWHSHGSKDYWKVTKTVGSKSVFPILCRTTELELNQNLQEQAR